MADSFISASKIRYQMTDQLHQKAKAQEFSLTMFAAIGGASTVHFLGEFEKEMDRKKSEVLATDKTDDEKNKELTDYGNAMAQRTHMLIRHHTALLVGGFTQDMFPELMPKPEEAKAEVEKQASDDFGNDPTPIVVGITGIPSEERVMS
jgi:hypothetical protein